MINWMNKLSVKTAQVMDSDFEPIDDYTSYTRYIWATKQEIEQTIQQHNGMPMNDIGYGWFGIHVGGDEWVTILQRDYDRSGPVCEVEFSNLPEGFYETRDPDLSIGGKVDSFMIVSKSPIIPAECITIRWEKDTEQAAEDSGFEYGDDYWQMASRKNWLTKIANTDFQTIYYSAQPIILSMPERIREILDMKLDDWMDNTVDYDEEELNQITSATDLLKYFLIDIVDGDYDQSIKSYARSWLRRHNFMDPPKKQVQYTPQRTDRIYVERDHNNRLVAVLYDKVFQLSKTYTLNDILEFVEVDEVKNLFRRYGVNFSPEKVKIAFLIRMAAAGMYDNNIVKLNIWDISINKNPKEQLNLTLIHELQHYLSYKTNWYKSREDNHADFPEQITRSRHKRYGPQYYSHPIEMAARMEEIVYLRRSGKSDEEIIEIMKHSDPGIKDDFIRSLISNADLYILGQSNWLQKISKKNKRITLKINRI